MKLVRSYTQQQATNGLLFAAETLLERVAAGKSHDAFHALHSAEEFLHAARKLSPRADWRQQAVEQLAAVQQQREKLIEKIRSKT